MRAKYGAFTEELRYSLFFSGFFFFYLRIDCLLCISFYSFFTFILFIYDHAAKSSHFATKNHFPGVH